LLLTPIAADIIMLHVITMYVYFARKMGEAKQIIFFNKQKKFKLKKEELEKILNQDHVIGLPIVVLSVIGVITLI